MLAEEGLLLLGDDFLPWIVLAFGAAMVVGNVMALVRPPEAARGKAAPGQAAKPPFGRAVVMIGIGLLAAVWGLASLLS